MGDVLRACSCTTFVFPTNSLFGAKPPQRHIVCYGADQQKWSQARSSTFKCMHTWIISTRFLAVCLLCPALQDHLRAVCKISVLFCDVLHKSMQQPKQRALSHLCRS